MERLLMTLFFWSCVIVSQGLCDSFPNPFDEKDRLDRKGSLAVVARAGLLDATLNVKGKSESYLWKDVFAMTRRGIDFKDKERGLVGVPAWKIDSRVLAKLGFKAADLKDYYDDLESDLEVSAARKGAEGDLKRKRAEAFERKKYIQKHRVPANIKIAQVQSNGVLGDIQSKRRVTKMKVVTALGHKEPRKEWVSGPSVFGFVEGDFSANVDGDLVPAWVIPAGTYQYTTPLGEPKTIRRFEAVNRDK